MTSRDVFTWEGRRFHCGDLKVAELEALEKTVGIRYGALIPRFEMGHRIAFMRLFLGVDRAPDVVDKILGDMTGAQSDEAWTVEDDDLPDVYEDGQPSGGVAPLTDTS